MRATDIIRNVLDVIDGIDTPQEEPTVDATVTITAAPIENRFKQIVDLISAERAPTELANSPQEQYADIDAVTVNAGGGVNGPKHPTDLRIKDPTPYPTFTGMKHVS